MDSRTSPEPLGPSQTPKKTEKSKECVMFKADKKAPHFGQIRLNKSPPTIILFLIVSQKKKRMSGPRITDQRIKDHGSKDQGSKDHGSRIKDQRIMD